MEVQMARWFRSLTARAMQPAPTAQRILRADDRDGDGLLVIFPIAETDAVAVIAKAAVAGARNAIAAVAAIIDITFTLKGTRRAGDYAQ